MWDDPWRARRDGAMARGAMARGVCTETELLHRVAVEKAALQFDENANNKK